MSNEDMWVQLAAVIWVVGGSLFMYKKADWLVAMNARFGIRANRDIARNFFMFTLILGLMGAVLLAFAAISRLFGH